MHDSSEFRKDCVAMFGTFPLDAPFGMFQQFGGADRCRKQQNRTITCHTNITAADILELYMHSTPVGRYRSP